MGDVADTSTLATADYCFTKRSIDRDFRLRRFVSRTFMDSGLQKKMPVGIDVTL